MLREPTLPLFREDELAVRDDVVLALAALFDLGLVLGLVVQLGRETRGPCVIAVSDGAVLDQNLCHARNLPPVNRVRPCKAHGVRPLRCCVTRPCLDTHIASTRSRSHGNLADGLFYRV